jgi:hypothetical protein
MLRPKHALDDGRPSDYVGQNSFLLDKPMSKSTRVVEGNAGRAKKRAGAGGDWVTKREASTGQFGSRVAAVMSAAERSGLTTEKSGRIGGRVSPELIRQAKAQTGIETDTDLIEFALANVALEDRFADAFKASRGKVDRDLKLGF